MQPAYGSLKPEISRVPGKRGACLCTDQYARKEPPINPQQSTVPNGMAALGRNANVQKNQHSNPILTQLNAQAVHAVETMSSWPGSIGIGSWASLSGIR